MQRLLLILAIIFGSACTSTAQINHKPEPRHWPSYSRADYRCIELNCDTSIITCDPLIDGIYADSAEYLDSNPNSLYTSIRFFQYWTSIGSERVYRDFKQGDSIPLKVNSENLLKILVKFKLNNLLIFRIPNTHWSDFDSLPPNISITTYVRAALYDSLFNVLKREDYVKSLHMWDYPFYDFPIKEKIKGGPPSQNKENDDKEIKDHSVGGGMTLSNSYMQSIAVPMAFAVVELAQAMKNDGAVEEEKISDEISCFVKLSPKLLLQRHKCRRGEQIRRRSVLSIGAR